MNRLFLEKFISNEASGIRIDCKNHTHELLKRQYQIYSVENNSSTSGDQ